MEIKRKFSSWVRDVTSSEWKYNSVNMRRPEWNQRMAVKKGDIGERIVKNILEKKGWIVYKCVSHDKPHIIDLIAYKNKKFVRFFEVKTKKFMPNPEQTGVNTSNLDVYKHFWKEHNQNIFLLFVDEAKKEIYGNFLSKLMEAKVEENVSFPHEFTAKDGTSITTFPLSSMKRNIAKLTEEQIKELIKFTKK